MLLALIVAGIVLVFIHIPGADPAYSVLGLVTFAGFTCSTSSSCGSMRTLLPRLWPAHWGLDR